MTYLKIVHAFARRHVTACESADFSVFARGRLVAPRNTGNDELGRKG
jgi:hypothetical protein